MLARGILTKGSIMMIGLMLFSSIYDMQQKYKYSNCKITNFKFITTSGEDILQFEIPTIFGNKTRVMNVEFSKIKFPSNNKDKECEVSAFSMMNVIIAQEIESSKSRVLVLKTCRPKDTLTKGEIYVNNENLIKSMVKNKRILLKRPWWKWNKKINWCEYRL